MDKLKKELHLVYLRGGILKELFGFLLTHKMWWAVPLILLTIVLVLVFIIGQTTGVAPFLYPLF